MELGNLTEFGYGLNRPECVLTHESGLVFVPDWAETGGICVIGPDEQCTKLVANANPGTFRPNGIALEPGGHFLVAHLGDKAGGVLELRPNGDLRALVTHANGAPLPPTNFVFRDVYGKIWLTVSTVKQPRAQDYRKHAATGFIAVAEPGQTDARIVADGLGYTNECVIDYANNVLYVNETFTRKLSRFDVSEDGTLTNRITVCRFGEGIYPDGLALDENGDIWIASIVSNSIVKVKHDDGSQSLILDDSDPALVQAAETAYQHDQLSSNHLSVTSNLTTLKHTSSLAFGGANLDQVYFGNLADSRIHRAKSNVNGSALPHWQYHLGHLESLLL